MMTSPEFNELATALAKAQAEFSIPKKLHTAKVPTKTGGSYSYRYSTLDELLAATVPALTKHGLSVLQDLTSPDGGTVSVVTVLLHSSGQSWQSGAFVLPSGATPQTAGAAATYGRRYSLGAALGIAAEEDDDAATVPAKAASSEDEGPHPPADDVAGDRCLVVDVSERKGETRGKPWLLYSVKFSDGRVGGTFDEKVALAAEHAKEARLPVEPVLEESPTRKGSYKLIELTSDEVF